MQIHHQNLKEGMIIKDGINRFFVIELDTGSHGETIVRGTNIQPGRDTEPTITQIFRHNEKAELIGSFAL